MRLNLVWYRVQAGNAKQGHCLRATECAAIKTVGITFLLP